jgi:hypothetical protein
MHGQYNDRRTLAFAQPAQGRVEDHRRVVRRHPVRDGVERFLQVLDDLAVADQLRRLQRVANDLRDLAGSDVLVAGAVDRRVRQSDGAPNLLDPGARC